MFFSVLSEDGIIEQIFMQKATSFLQTKKIQ